MRFINEELNEHGNEEEIYAPQGDFRDFEDDWRPTSTHLHVVRYLHTASKDEN